MNENLAGNIYLPKLSSYFSISAKALSSVLLWTIFNNVRSKRFLWVCVKVMAYIIKVFKYTAVFQKGEMVMLNITSNLKKENVDLIDIFNEFYCDGYKMLSILLMFYCTCSTHERSD